VLPLTNWIEKVPVPDPFVGETRNQASFGIAVQLNGCCEYGVTTTLWAGVKGPTRDPARVAAKVSVVRSIQKPPPDSESLGAVAETSFDGALQIPWVLYAYTRK
jgi:hypothetical protein